MAILSIIIAIVSLSFSFPPTHARIPGVYSGGPWQSAHATFYGGSDASGTMGMYIIYTLFFVPNKCLILHKEFCSNHGRPQNMDTSLGKDSNSGLLHSGRLIPSARPNPNFINLHHLNISMSLQKQKQNQIIIIIIMVQKGRVDTGIYTAKGTA